MLCDEITPIILPQISVMQHSFLKGRSTVTNLVEFYNFFIDKIENGHQVDGVFRLDEEFLADGSYLALVLFDWPHSARQA
jgi:hypothetical protein